MEYDAATEKWGSSIWQKKISKIHCLVEKTEVEKSMIVGYNLSVKHIHTDISLRTIHKKLNSDCLWRGNWASGEQGPGQSL